MRPTHLAPQTVDLGLALLQTAREQRLLLMQLLVRIVELLTHVAQVVLEELAILGVLVLLLDGAEETKRPLLSAAWVGWCWGFGQFLVGLYWVAYAFLVDAANHAWQIPFVETLLPGGLALFFAAGKSILLATTTCGFCPNSGSKSSSSRLTVFHRARGSSPSIFAASSKWINKRVRVTCRKNLCPKPWPW